jgi:hypothetical protein
VIRNGQFQDVNSALEAGIRVRVATEVHAHPLEKFDQRAGRVVRAAVERHVLEKMRQAPLIILLVQRSGEHQQAQRTRAPAARD